MFKNNNKWYRKLRIPPSLAPPTGIIYNTKEETNKKVFKDFKDWLVIHIYINIYIYAVEKPRTKRTKQ
jgi:hypothetical protein